ncbi:hypothetical protein RND81_04G092500 [Saponaria officinalis]|uniref:Uncharacterized protein n=1 Tax=Saponaria officinalis TaxID=3572 RepID=A0AAW1LDK1_SAPOF
MGCSRFLGCFFGNSKKRLKNSHIPLHNSSCGNATVAAKQYLFDDSIHLPPLQSWVVEPEEEKLNLTNQHKQQEQLSLGAQKRVTFDSNVKECDRLSCNEAPGILEVDEKRVEADSTKSHKSSSSSESGSTSSSLVSLPPNHRYRNLRECDDEASELDEDENEPCVDDDNKEGHDDDDDDDGEECNAEYSDDEYYSKQVPEISTRLCSFTESGIKSSTACASNDRHGDEPTNGNVPLDEETNTPPVFYRGARDRTGYVHSVLNPVENTAQWKNVKAKQTPSMKHHQKENSQMDPGFKELPLKPKSKLVDPGNYSEVTVDASLSTWLGSSLKTTSDKPMPIGLEPISSSASMSSQGSKSVRTKGERAILVALTTGELKQFRAPSSPRSPSRSPNEKPLVGTAEKPTPIGLEPISSSASMSSQGSKSVRTKGERAILIALTTGELKQFPTPSSPRRSPSRSPNEKPLVGTVGIHWDNGNDRTPVADSSSSSSFKGIPNTTSKYREDKRVTWHSTPFETRLERALNRGAADSRR